jgi:hypothetical protein
MAGNHREERRTPFTTDLMNIRVADTPIKNVERNIIDANITPCECVRLD